MRFHCLAVQHTITHIDFTCCAFTQKVLKFCAMMSRRGHTIYHYGHEESEVECTEHISVVSTEMFQETYAGLNWRKDFFSYDNSDRLHKMYNANCIDEISKRAQQGDFLLCFFDQREVGNHFMSKGLIVVHPGIGSNNEVWCPYNIFESYAVMNNTYGFKDPKQQDAVIPNYFDPANFRFKRKKGDYLLMIGRMIIKKGLNVAEDVAMRTKHKLIVAGQGTYKSATGRDGPPPNFVKLVGFADMEKRKELLANAKAVLAPTYYSEPFGGIVMEAAFSGTPVITTDVGAFPETVKHGKTGYRCRTMESFCWAVNNIHNIKPRVCRKWAVSNYSMSVVALKYEEYFRMIRNVKHGQNFFYDFSHKRTELGWMETRDPQEDELEQSDEPEDAEWPFEEKKSEMPAPIPLQVKRVPPPPPPLPPLLPLPSPSLLPPLLPLSAAFESLAI